MILNKLSGLEARILFYGLETIGIFLLIVLFESYLACFLRSRDLTRLLSFAVVLLWAFEMLLPRFQPLWYPYDSYACAFLTAGLILLYRERWSLYYPLFFLAVLNRETAGFLTVFFLLTQYGRKPFKFLLWHISCQALIWIAVKLVLGFVFADHPGELFQNQWRQNVRFFTEAGSPHELIFRFAFILGNFAFLWPVPLLYWHLLESEFLRRTYGGLFLFYLGMLFTANIFEYRIFGEVVPVLLAPVLVIVTEISRRAGKDDNAD